MFNTQLIDAKYIVLCSISFFSKIEPPVKNIYSIFLIVFIL